MVPENEYEPTTMRGHNKPTILHANQKGISQKPLAGNFF